MTEPRIYLDYKHQEATIEEAIAWLTDDRIDAGDWCDQTLCDMRDAMLAMYMRLASATDRVLECGHVARFTTSRFGGEKHWESYCTLCENDCLTARLAAAESALREILDRAEEDDVVSCIAIASKAIGLRMFVGNPPNSEDEAAKGGRDGVEL